MAEILQDDDFRLVLLSRNTDYEHSEELQSKFQTNECVLVRFRSFRKTKHFHLTSEELDALTVAWQAYKADKAAEEQAERAQKQSERDKIIQEAWGIVRNYPDIEFTTYPHYHGKGRPGWQVAIPSLDWKHNDILAHPNDALYLAKQAVEIWKAHQKPLSR